MKSATINNVAAGLIVAVIYGVIVITIESPVLQLVLMALFAIALIVLLLLSTSLKSSIGASMRPIVLDRFKKRRFDIIVKELKQGIALHKRRGDVPRIYTTSLGVNNTAHIDKEAFQDFIDILNKAVDRREAVNICLFSIHDAESAARVLGLVDRFRDNPCFRVRVAFEHIQQESAFLVNLFIIEGYAGYLAFEHVNGETVAFNARRSREISAIEDLYNSLSSQTGFKTLKDENGVKTDIYDIINKMT